MVLCNNQGKKSIYFIGIGGVSMSALALHFHHQGYSVRGSDRQNSALIDRLRGEGISVFIGDEEDIREDVVVYTGAISRTNRQLLKALRDGKEVYSRAQLLGMLSGEFPHVIGISGCHGKTTCTAMITHIFACAKKAFTCMIGGEDLTFSNYFSTGKDYLIAEACEYQKSFLHLKCECAVVLNIDLDHMDCYDGEEDLLSCFQAFAFGAAFSVYSAESRRCSRLSGSVNFGLTRGDYRAEQLTQKNGVYAFRVIRNGVFLTNVQLSVPGKVHVSNALAAFAVAEYFGIPCDVIALGLQTFQGVKRRFERVGLLRGCEVICDYAHHPNELTSTLQTAQKVCAGTLYTVFQPHTYSRTDNLFDAFLKVLLPLRNLIVYRTYAARETKNGEDNAKALAGRLPDAKYADGEIQLQALLEEIHFQKGDILLVLGAGDIYDIIRRLIRR